MYAKVGKSTHNLPIRDLKQKWFELASPYNSKYSNAWIITERFVFIRSDNYGPVITFQYRLLFRNLNQPVTFFRIPNNSANFSYNVATLICWNSCNILNTLALHTLTR